MNLYWMMNEPRTNVATGAEATIELPLGDHTMSLVASDGTGLINDDTARILVQDTTPPQIVNIALEPDCLWPPQHGFVRYRLGIEAQVEAVDACETPETPVSVRNKRVVSSQPDDGIGDGSTADDERFTWEAQTLPVVPWIGAAAKVRIRDVEVLDPRTTGAVDTVTTTTTATTATTCNALGTQAKADVNAEADAALADVNLDHLVGTATGIPSVVAGTYLDQIMDDGTATYDRTTDSLQALRDDVATGSEIVGLIFSEPVPSSYTSGMFGYVVGTNLNATVSSRSTLDAAAVNTEVDTALADIHMDHLLAVDYDPASKPGVATALLNELVESPKSAPWRGL